MVEKAVKPPRITTPQAVDWGCARIKYPRGPVFIVPNDRVAIESNKKKTPPIIQNAAWVLTGRLTKIRFARSTGGKA